jgi:NADH dehydrogenase FAD-containing subunit
MVRIVVLGAGIGRISQICELSQEPGKQHDIKMVLKMVGANQLKKSN